MRLTIVLYDQLIQDIGRAGESISTASIEQCAKEIGHAIAVIGYLQATLRIESGRQVARNLGHFYTMLREKLTEAQVRSSRQTLGELQQQLIEVREAWIKVETDTVITAQ